MKTIPQRLFVYGLNAVRAAAWVTFLGSIYLIPFAFILRDGLGPDAGPPSEGVEAILRTLGTCAPLVWALLGSGLLLLATRFALKRSGFWVQAERGYLYFLVFILLPLGGFLLYWFL